LKNCFPARTLHLHVFDARHREDDRAQPR
jgi:hypothetical protein